MPRLGRCARSAVALVVAALAACGGGSDQQVSSLIATPRQLTGSELRYGAVVQQGGGVVYQPDVVFVGGGAGSVKAVSADGLIWTISGSADHASDLQPGRVIVVTNFGAGRVLGTQPAGSDVQVAIGPVAITDVIREGSIDSGGPMALGGFEAYQTPTLPGLVADASEATTLGDTLALPHTRLLATPVLPPLPDPSTTVPNSAAGDFRLQSSCCTSIGLHLGYDKNGARLLATAHLEFDHPTVAFHLRIARGSLIDAGVELKGAAGIKFDLSAATLNTAADFKVPRVQVPVDITIPIQVGPLPMTVGVQQIFSVGVGLSGEASFTANGEYKIGGSLGFGVTNGSPIVPSLSVETVKSVLDSITVLSIGSSGLSFGYAVKVTVGIGTWSLSAGVWYQVAATLAVGASGTPGTSLVTCKTAALGIDGTYGVGYKIPDFVAKAINFFLNTVFRNPTPVLPSGGPHWGPTTLFEKSLAPCSK